MENLPGDWQDLAKDYLATIDCVVIEGGGVRGLAYPAAWAMLEPVLPQKISTYVGTSAGAITALGLSLGLDAAKLRSIAVDTPWKEWASGILWRAPWSRRAGLHSLEPALEWIGDLLEMCGHARYITLADLHFSTRRSLTVCAWEETTQPTSLAVLNADTEPHMPVATAVAASMAIPGFFEPVVWRGRQFVDGGVAANFPARIALQTHTANEILGLRVDRPVEFELGRVAVPPRGLARRLIRISSGLRAHVHAHVPEEIWERTIRIVEGTVDTTDFDLSPEALARLENAAEKAVRKSVSKWCAV